MLKTSAMFGILALTLTAGGCDNKAGPTPTKSAEVPGPVHPAPELASAEPVKAEPGQPGKPIMPVDDRVLADSGLGVGGKFKPFNIVNCDSGEQYCQVCKFGGSPKIMAVGTIDDPEFRNDLQNLDALVQKYGEDRLKAFAVVTDIKDGSSSTPLAEREALLAKLKALRAELGVKLPIVIPDVEDGAHKAFDDYYNVTASRTLMFADGRNLVKYSAVAPKDLSELNTAILSVLGATSATAATPPAAG